jgi:hypothetical protein
MDPWEGNETPQPFRSNGYSVDNGICAAWGPCLTPSCGVGDIPPPRLVCRGSDHVHIHVHVHRHATKGYFADLNLTVLRMDVLLQCFLVSIELKAVRQRVWRAGDPARWEPVLLIGGNDTG